MIGQDECVYKQFHKSVTNGLDLTIQHYSTQKMRVWALCCHPLSLVALKMDLNLYLPNLKQSMHTEQEENNTLTRRL